MRYVSYLAIDKHIAYIQEVSRANLGISTALQGINPHKSVRIAINGHSFINLREGHKYISLKIDMNHTSICYPTMKSFVYGFVYVYSS